MVVMSHLRVFRAIWDEKHFRLYINLLCILIYSMKFHGPLNILNRCWEIHVKFQKAANQNYTYSRKAACVQTRVVKHIPIIFWVIHYCSIAFATICSCPWPAPDAFLRTTNKWETCCPNTNIGRQSSFSEPVKYDKSFSPLCTISGTCVPKISLLLHISCVDAAVAEWFSAKSVRLCLKPFAVWADIMIQSQQQFCGNYLLPTYLCFR